MYKSAKKQDLLRLVEEIGEKIQTPATIIELKTKIEESAVFLKDPDFIKDLIQNIIEERQEKIEEEKKLALEKDKEREKTLEIQKLEREIELENAKNRSVSIQDSSELINEGTEVATVKLESLIKSVRTLSMAVPSKPENFNLFFQTLERAFVIKHVPVELKSEILLNLLGDKANNILLYMMDDEMKDYEKLKELVLREFQPTPQECLNNFKKSQRSRNESHMQYASRLSANFQYYLKLREVKDFETLCELMISDKMFETLDKDTASHVGIRQGENWFKPTQLAKECDIYFVSKGKSLNDVQSYTRVSTDNYYKLGSKDYRNRNYEFRERVSKRSNENDFKCYICGSKYHFARACDKRVQKPPQSEITKNIGSVNQIESDTKSRKIDIVELEYVNIFINGNEIKSLIDSGSQVMVINSNFIKIDNPFKEKITLKGIFGDARKVSTAEVEIALKGSRPLNVTAAISSELKAQCIIPPRIYKMLQEAEKQSETDRAGLNRQLAPSDKSTVSPDVRRDLAAELNQTNIENEKHFFSVANLFSDNTEIDVVHLSDLKMRKEVLDIVNNYKPNKTLSTELKMTIVLKDEIPVCQRSRRLSFLEKKQVEKQVKEWLDKGIIQNSCSDFASPVVLCKKKDGSIRLCIDFRGVNKKMVKDRFPLPIIQDVFDQLQSGKVFTTIDLKNGFFHVDVDENSYKYTSFVTHEGQYEFKKVPFGLSNSPSVFQRYIYHVFRDLIKDGTVIVYMDDIIIPSVDEREGVKQLIRVLDTASKYGLDLNLKKCQFLKRKIEFLGRIIEDGTIRPSVEKIEAVKRFPEPKTVKAVQSFLGLTGYFREYLRDYAHVAKPLSDLLRQTTVFQFGAEQKAAFETLKEALSNNPILHLFKQGAKLELHTDASKFGYGSILLQQSDDGKLHPIHYMSRKTTVPEEKYSSYELEVLAIIESLKKFRHYLLGSKFKIVTDCSAFQQTMSKTELTPKIARWALFLEDFDYEIVHRSGKQMRHVDALSRYPVMMVSCEDLTAKIVISQSNDEYIKTIKKLMTEGKNDEYVIKNEVLYKIEKDRDVLVVPQGMQLEVVKSVHVSGHFAVAKTENLVRQDFYFPNIKKCVEQVVSNCLECILVNKKRGKAEGFLHPIPKEDIPLSTYHIDFIGPLPSTNKNYKHIFTVVDAFTKFVWFYPVKSTSTQEVLKKLKQQQAIFGNPFRIVTDRGAAFTAKEFDNYCKEENIQHVNITTGIPRGNGQIERMHGTLIPVLSKLSIEDPTKWFKYVENVQRIMNSTISRSTKRSPFELLTGVKMRNKEEVKILEVLEEEFLDEMMKSREKEREEARKNILKIQEENCKGFNKKRKKAFVYKKGDMIAIQRTQFGSGLKLRPKFYGPYEIIQVKTNDRYEVKKVGQHEGPNLTSTAADHMKQWGNDT